MIDTVNDGASLHAITLVGSSLHYITFLIFRHSADIEIEMTVGLTNTQHARRLQLDPPIDAMIDDTTTRGLAGVKDRGNETVNQT